MKYRIFGNGLLASSKAVKEGTNQVYSRIHFHLLIALNDALCENSQ